MAWFHHRPFFFLPGATLALFIVGLLLVRHRVFEEPLAHRGVLAGLAAFGVVSWLVSNWMLPGLALLLRDQWLTFTYVPGGPALLAWRPPIADRLRGCAMAGRMALTNYLLQIAVLDLLFAGYAIGLRRIRPVWGLTAALGCFLAEVAFS